MEKEIKYKEWPTGVYELNTLSAVKRCWEFTYRKMTQINMRLNECIDNPKISVVVAGSYGRYEANEQSDLDFFIISEEDKNVKLQDYCEEVKKIAMEFNIPLPNSEGIFSSCISIHDLVNNIGHKDDNIKSLVQRLVLLMESKSLYNKTLYERVFCDVLDRYLDLVVANPNKEAVFLLNDTIRCFRSICVSNQFQFFNEREKWTLRNIKLRHSRVMSYASLLLLIMNASKYADKPEYIRKHIELAPIERVAHVFTDNNMTASEILHLYNIFLDKISIKEIRGALEVDYKNRYTNPYYDELKRNSDILQTELTKFIFAQKDNWSDRIYEYLIF